MEKRVKLTEQKIKNIRDQVLKAIKQVKPEIYFPLTINNKTKKLLKILTLQRNILFLIEELINFLEEKNLLISGRERDLINNFIFYYIGKQLFPTQNKTEKLKIDNNLILKNYPDTQKTTKEIQKIFDYYFPKRFNQTLVNSFVKKFLTDYFQRHK